MSFTDPTLEELQAKRLLFSYLTVKVKGEEYPYLHGVARHPGQASIHFHPWSRYVANWGRRTGKTIMGAAEAFYVLTVPDTRTWIIAPTYDLTDRVFEYIWKWAVKDEVWQQMGYENPITAKGFPSQGTRYIRTAWGAYIKCRSADSGANIGEQLDLLLMDEAARVNKDVWESDLKPALVDRKGRALFISTPRGRNYFHKLYKRGEEPETVAQGWRSSTFRTWDNPFVDPAYVKEEQETMDDTTFRREFGASFEHFSGLIYPQYLDTPHDFHSLDGGHLYDPDEIPLPLDRMTIYRAADVGSGHPTVWIWGAVGPITHGNFVGREDDLWLFMEYMGKTGASHPEHAKQAKALSAGLNIYDGYLPPDSDRTHKVNETAEFNKSVRDVYADHGIHTRTANNDFSVGVSAVRSYLGSTLEDTPSHGRVFISKRLANIRWVMLNYVWADPPRTIEEKDAPGRPRKYKDDAADALRYLLVMEPQYDSRLMVEVPRYGTPDREPAQQGRQFGNNVRIMGR